MKKLDELGKPVTNEEIDDVIRDHKTIDGEVRSDDAFEVIVRTNFGLSMSEYRRMIMLSLAKKKYSVEIDERAANVVKSIKDDLGTTDNLKDVSGKYVNNDIVSFESLSEAVESSNLDSGRALTAYLLKDVGDVSEPFVSKNGDGYYFVKLTAREGNKVKYDSVWIRFTEFDKVMEQIRSENKVEEYIDVELSNAAEEEGASEKDENEELEIE